MRRLVVVALALFLSLVLMAPAAFGHAVGPCDALDNDPGNSGYAKHHIVALAHEGLLGQFHKPGEHHGFSACLED